MYSSEFSSSVLTTSNMYEIHIMAWHHIFSSPWALACLAISCILLGLSLRKWAHLSSAGQTLLEQDIRGHDEKCMQDSPFFAYLGHNAITESKATDSANTSIHAIHRIPKHIRFNNATDSLTMEPRSYDFDKTPEDLSNIHWRSFSYPDTSNMQVSFDSVRLMRDEEHGRQWSRKTIQFCGV